MPQLISDRFRLDLRLGRDGDVEEWLGTDTTLERPVLVRILDPAADPERREGFLAGARAAATLSHVHLAAVYAVGTVSESAYEVEEWSGGVRISDRLDADEPIPVAEFLPNAAGLAAALAALHESGFVHGAVDTRHVEFSAAHPAKLHGWGSEPRWEEPGGDTVALAEVLAVAIAGRDASPLDGIQPSQLRAELPQDVDRALALAASGALDAGELATALTAVPTTPPARRDRWSWRWAVVAAVLGAIALVAAGLGLALRVRPSDSPFLFPAVPIPSSSTSPTTTAPPPGDDGSPTVSPPPVSGVLAAVPTVLDPFGDDSERDADLGLLVDGDGTTAWRTERYFEPLPVVKPGVGVSFATTGIPVTVEIVAGDGVGFMLSWSAEPDPDPNAWERIAAGRVLGGRVVLPVPARRSGNWLLWLTDLPLSGDAYVADVYEVRFRS